MSWSGMVRFGEELVIVDRTFLRVSLRVLGRGMTRRGKVRLGTARHGAGNSR